MWQDACVPEMRLGLGPNENEFALLYQELAPKVYAYVLRRLGNREDAEDITGEVFLRALASRSRPSGSSPVPWIFTIARNLMIDRSRRRKHMATESIGEQAGRSVDRDDEIVLQGFLAELPAETRDVILLRLAVGLSVEEVGSIIGKSTGAVKMMAHRGLARLRQRWSEEVLE